MATHLETLKWINSFVVVMALIVIGISGYAGYSGQGHFNFAYIGMILGIIMEILACWGLIGAKLGNVKMLVIYFWILFTLITGQVIVLVLTFFRKDDVFSYVTTNAESFKLTSQEEIKSIVKNIEDNMAFLGVCLSVLILVQTLALILASMHFKQSCLRGLSVISRFGGQALFFIGVGVHLGSSSTETEFGHASFFGYLCMVIGGYLFLVGDLGVRAVDAASPSLIGLYFWIMLTTLIVEIGGCFAIVYRKQDILELVRTKMSNQAAEFSDREIQASLQLVQSHMQVAAIISFLLVFKQTLAMILSLNLRSEIRGGQGVSDLIDQELLEILPSVAGQGRNLLQDYSKPSKWSDTYNQMRRKYEDFD